MGKRRIRCLNVLNQKKIAGFDIRKDRRIEAKKIYKIQTYEKIDIALREFKPNAIIISTSPKFHMKYAYISLRYNIPCFIEASVCNLKKIEKLYKKNLKKKVLIAPSCTMIFNDGIEKIKNAIDKKLIGKVNYINYHVGQYLPDWHPWEKKGHYVWDKDSNGCKELIPFELTWLHNVFGKIDYLNSLNFKLSDLKINFNDLSRFSIMLNKKILADITIEVLSRPLPTRELTILGSKGKIILSTDQQLFKYTNLKSKNYKSFPINTGKIIKGYINSEKPYIKEVKSFIKAIKKPHKNKFPNDLKKDIMILKIMKKIINK